MVVYIIYCCDGTREARTDKQLQKIYNHRRRRRRAGWLRTATESEPYTAAGKLARLIIPRTHTEQTSSIHVVEQTAARGLDLPVIVVEAVCVCVCV